MSGRQGRAMATTYEPLPDGLEQQHRRQVWRTAWLGAAHMCVGVGEDCCLCHLIVGLEVLSRKQCTIGSCFCGLCRRSEVARGVGGQQCVWSGRAVGCDTSCNDFKICEVV